MSENLTQLDSVALEAATMSLLGKTKNDLPDINWFASRSGTVSQWKERTYYAITVYLATVAEKENKENKPEREPYGYLWYTKHMEYRFTHLKPTQGFIGEPKPVYE